MGFDDAVLAEKRFPNKEDLDQVSTDVPICIIHTSGHFGVLNSKGLEMNNKTAETPNPKGGIIRRMPNSQEPNGVLEELAAIPVSFPLLTPSDPELMDYYISKGQDMAVKHGYTTAQEGRAMGQIHSALTNFSKTGNTYINNGGISRQHNILGFTGLQRLWFLRMVNIHPFQS